MEGPKKAGPHEQHLNGGGSKARDAGGSAAGSRANYLSSPLSLRHNQSEQQRERKRDRKRERERKERERETWVDKNMFTKAWRRIV